MVHGVGGTNGPGSYGAPDPDAFSPEKCIALMQDLCSWGEQLLLMRSEGLNPSAFWKDNKRGLENDLKELSAWGKDPSLSPEERKAFQTLKAALEAATKPGQSAKSLSACFGKMQMSLLGLIAVMTFTNLPSGLVSQLHEASALFALLTLSVGLQNSSSKDCKFIASSAVTSLTKYLMNLEGAAPAGSAKLITYLKNTIKSLKEGLNKDTTPQEFHQLFQKILEGLPSNF